jgi:UDP-N-acetylglucosamine--N-acetylmuramyl-(pentapeptide) pyrophosphoryl-undecaprenol N-acetylglucosamine transferase
MIAGGGTGGHLYPAIAIAEAFKQRMPATEFVFIGTLQGIEARVLPKLGYRLQLVPVRGLQRRWAWENLILPMRLLQSMSTCRKLLREFRPHLIIGTGGYVSMPALLAAWLSRRKFVIQEQNSFPGLVNRRLGNFADAVFLSFAESRKFFKPSPRVHVVGNPVRANLQERTSAQREAAAVKWNLEKDKITLLVFGGSQGARRINEMTMELMPRLATIPDLQILWATGPAHYDKIAPKIGAHKAMHAVPYLDDMNLAYALADFVLCRAGASTIFEIAQCGLPALLVPFPFATADHQTHNARAMAQAGAARMFIEHDLNAGDLFSAIRDLASNEAMRREMSKSARQLAKPRAAEEIVEVCLEVLRQ